MICMNCAWVVFTAWSGILLTNAISMASPPLSARRVPVGCDETPRSARADSWLAQARIAALPIIQQNRCRTNAGCPCNRVTQCSIEIIDDVIDMFDSDAEPDHLWRHACPCLFLWQHLTMSCRGGMTGERLRVADIDQALEQLQRI